MHQSRLGYRVRTGLLISVLGLTSASVAPTMSAQAPALALGLSLNDPAISPGDTLVAGITVDNPAGGPLADVFFVILLPDGTTIVSLTPGGPRPGTLANLGTLAPVVRGISLAGAFTYNNAAFFTYPFSGIEPTGLYRIFFVTARTGAFDDGAIDAGDLLGVASQDFVVGTSSVTVDTGRAVTTTVPVTGGAVQTSAADGTGFSLNVLGGAVRGATAITIAPLLAFDAIPSGPLVAGISAEPSGLHFDTPATLTITLPSGFQPPAFGLRGFIADSDGRNLQTVPARLTGNVVTMAVPHFSVAGVALTNDWMEPCATPRSAEMTTACQQLRPLYDAEVARLASQGGPLGMTFQLDVGLVLDDWARVGILPRMQDAQQMPGAADPFLKPSTVLQEWSDWLSLYEPVFGATFDRTNQSAGLPLGTLIDQIQGEARLTYRAGRDAINVKCLADKANVATHVKNVTLLFLDWFAGVPFGPGAETLEYCAAIRVDAFPPPVLTPGQGSAMPVDVRLRFIDGQDLPAGELLSVAITATNAGVSPAGGVLPSPIAGNVTLTPSSTSSVVTISAAVVNAPLDLLPSVTKTFQAGQSQPVPWILDDLFLTISCGASVGPLFDSCPNQSGGTTVTMPTVSVVGNNGTATVSNTSGSALAEVNGTALDLVLTGRSTLASTGPASGGGAAGASVVMQHRGEFRTLQSLSCTLSLAVQRTGNPTSVAAFVEVVGPGGQKAFLNADGSATFACPAGSYRVNANATGATNGTAAGSLNVAARLSVQ